MPIMDSRDETPSGGNILFTSPHCLLDFTAGAAVATARTLELLAGLGFPCHAFCGTLCDAPIALDALLARLPHATRPGVRIVETALEGAGWVPVSMFFAAKPAPRAFIEAFTGLLDLVRPAVLLTYGGDPLSRAIREIARSRGASVVFLLHNFAYDKAATFESVDYAVVPSEFSRRHFAAKLGLACHVLPYVIDPRQVGGGKGPHPNPLPEGEGTVGPGPVTEGEGGFLFDIPAQYTPETRELSTAEEVGPWVQTIARLWDDTAYYERWSRTARERARQWHPDRLAPVYCELFAGISRQPRQPLAPRES